MNEIGTTRLIGRSAAMAELRDAVERIGRTTSRVLITGESGVGKEVVARAIYDAGTKATPFVAVNCAGIPESLLESELFGHVKGSFTGAHRDQAGKLELPGGGTVFLDEIGEMPLRMQGLFLRYLETGEIQKVGAERPLTVVNVRVIAATNRDLREQIRLGLFREDVFYRLNVISVHVPPLRERRGDVPLLAEHFLQRLTAAQGAANGHGTRVRAIAPAAMNVLSRHRWPGNVRELQNVIERVVVTARRDVIEPDDLPSEVRRPDDDLPRPSRADSASVVDELFARLINGNESFWTAVYAPYMNREITRYDVRDLVHRGLDRARGNYKVVLGLFNMEPHEYKRFLNFLRKHDCQLPFMEYRQ